MAFTAKNAIIKIIKGNIGGDDSRFKTLKGLIEASKLNTTILNVQDFAERPGKLRELKVSYFPVNCDDDDTCPVDLCDTTPASLETVSFTLSECTAAKGRSVSINDVRNVDGEFMINDAAIGVIKGQLQEVRRKINKRAAAKLAALAMSSEFVDGDSFKTIQLVNPTTGALIPSGYFEIERAVEDAGLSSPFIFGGLDAFSWAKGQEIAGLNANGQALQGLSKGNTFYDRVLNDAFSDDGNNHLVGVSADAIKFIAYAENAGGFANRSVANMEELESMFRSGSTYLYSVIADPLTGLLYNLDIVMSPCSKLWNINVHVTWDLFTIPNGHCGNGEDVTGVFHFKTCKPIDTTCPTPENTTTYMEDAPTFPVAAAVGFIRNGITVPMASTSIANLGQLVGLLNSAFPDTKFVGNAANGVISYQGTEGQTIVIDATADVTLTFA